MITPIQIIIIIFALFAWSRAFIRMRSKDISPGEFGFWSFIWVSIILVAILPVIIWKFSELLGIGRAVDVAVYIGIIVLFYLVFRLYVRMEKHNQELTKLVREIAIDKAKKKK